jgi:HEAT repeat protein
MAVAKTVENLIERLTKPNQYAQKDDIILMDTSQFMAEFTRRCHKVRQEAALALVEIGLPAVEALIGQLGSDAQVVRVLSATSLGAIRDARTVDPLIHVLGDKDGVVRTAAAEALGTIADQRAVEPLKPLLTDNEFAVRKAAADAIGKITGTRPKVKGACFVVTATMGSYDAPTVLAFRAFRDGYLEKRGWGRRFIEWYYHYSPALAGRIAGSSLLRALSWLTLVKPCELLIRVLWRHAKLDGAPER